MTWCNRFKHKKTFKKELSRELMLVAWHSKRWWGCCVPEDDKREIEPFFIDEKQYKVVGLVSSKINMPINF